MLVEFRTMRFLLRHVLIAGFVFLITAGPAYSQTAQCCDRKYGISVSLPPGWKWVDTRRGGNRGKTVTFDEPGSQRELRLYVKVERSPKEITPEQMDTRLLKGVDRKILQRRTEGFRDYHLRENSFERRLVGGHLALSWVSEFKDQGGNKVEYLTRVRSEKSNALFFAVLPAAELDDFKKRVDPIIDTLRIP